jgi:hypothetical protein
LNRDLKDLKQLKMNRKHKIKIQNYKTSRRKHRRQVWQITSVIPATWDVEMKGSWFEAHLGKSTKHIIKMNKEKRSDNGSNGRTVA